MTRVQHRLLWCWNCFAFYIGCGPAGAIPSQKGHDLNVSSLDSRNKNRQAARDNVDPNTQGTLQALLLKLVCNASSYPLRTECCNTRPRRCDFVNRCEAGVHAVVLHSVALGSFAADHKLLLRNIAVLNWDGQESDHYKGVH